MNTDSTRAAGPLRPADRIGLMRACAHASEKELAAALSALDPLPAVADVRPPQTGLVMVRGRVCGEGNAFNLGEAIVTRASVILENGAVGHACLLGHSEVRARMSATLDALGQDPAMRSRIEDCFAAPLMARVADERRRRTEETAATRVDFFTMVRGEDQ